MTRRIGLSAALTFAIGLIAWMALAHPAQACGGFFCQNSPLDQNAERIIFTQNHDGTISAYIQIQFTGSAPEFSWILPLPSVIGVEDVEVPEDFMAAFQELEVLTDPVFIRPPLPSCVPQVRAFAAAPAAPAPAAVEVFASGEVGPYGFDVIGSDDPDALISWLRDHNYRVTKDMEPLIDIYVEEQFVFLAMQLLPEQGSQDVQPVKVTYRSERPMIPLRLTAVAANTDMAVMVWFYAEQQAVPVNYAKMNIADDELVFFGLGGTSNYRTLIGERADEFGGHAFITEFAAPSRELPTRHPMLQELGERYPYVTRLNTVISPEEMTVDPIFDYNPQLKDVSNIHDLSNMTGVYDCDRDEATRLKVASSTSVVAENLRTQVNALLGEVATLREQTTQSPAEAENILKEIDDLLTEVTELSGNVAGIADADDSTFSWLTLVVGVLIGGAIIALAGGLMMFGMRLGRRSGGLE